MGKNRSKFLKAADLISVPTDNEDRVYCLNMIRSLSPRLTRLSSAISLDGNISAQEVSNISRVIEEGRGILSRLREYYLSSAFLNGISPELYVGSRLFSNHGESFHALNEELSEFIEIVLVRFEEAYFV